MRQLLHGLRLFLAPHQQETESLQNAIRLICREISPQHEPQPISQLMLALYIFPNAVKNFTFKLNFKSNYRFNLHLNFKV